MKYFSATLTVILVLAFLTVGFSRTNQQNVQVIKAKNTGSLFQAAVPSSQTPSQSQIIWSSRGDSTIWVEEWETGAPGWFSIDETNPGAFWHQDDWNAYGGTGLSWWMADTANGLNGYLSHWYQVLDSPDIPLTGTPVLTFYHRLKCEDPAGATPPYDGWDGVNVRISTDGGSTWTVLTNPTPAYTVTSLYSFGFEFGEGPNVPGWAGSITTWTPVTIDLAAYTGQSVRIRFAFASDPAYDTQNDPTMFGWQVDEIKVADGANVLYYNDGTQSDMTASNNAPVGGDYWHIEVDPTAPSPTHMADSNDPATGSYHPNMIASYISPYFYLPDTLTEVYYDFSCQGTFSDNGTFPDVDYFGAYVQVKGENFWRYVSNITHDPSGTNYVYSSAPPFWALFSQSYSVGLVDLVTLMGDSIRVKFTFFSDEDAPMGTALQVDNAVVWSPDLNPPPPPAPTNLAGVAGDGYVDLTWDDLNTSGHQQFIYDDGTFENGIHVTSGTADAGVYFNSLSPSTIDTIWVWGSQYNTGTSTTLKVWEVGTGGIINPTPTYTKTVTLVNNIWNAYDVTADNWTVTGDFVAGIEISNPISVALDETTIPSAHSWVNLGGWQTWQAVAAANGLPDGEWGVRAAVTYSGGTSVTYNVYRRLQATPNYTTPIVTGLSNAFYHDDGVTNGETYCYVVTAVWPGQGESDYSNEVCGLTPQSSAIHELAYDDGTAESFYGIGFGNYVAVKFTLNHWPQDVVKLKVYFATGGGSVQVKVWDDNGSGGLPGTEIFSKNVSNLVQGWNETDATGVTISDGDFYVGYRSLSNTPDLGIDDTPPIAGMSYLRIGAAGTWENFPTLGLGDAMIRCLVDSSGVLGVGTIDPAMITEFELLPNYPNPFNPSTSISFLVPANMTGEKVNLSVFDLLGRKVVTLVDGVLSAGQHQVQWDGRDTAGNVVTSGIYFYTIKAGTRVQTRKMMLMK